MKKRYVIVPATMLLAIGACVWYASDVPEGLERDMSAENAKTFIEKLNAQDYDWCYSQFDDTMHKTMSRDQLERTFTSVFEGLGSLTETKPVSVSYKKSLGVNYAMCTVKCEYANGSAIFTVSFAKDMKIAGLYVK